MENSTMGGYNELAGVMGSYPGLCIFRRFLILNARNLLCLQAEIVNHEHALRVAIEDDRNAADPLRKEFESDISAMKGPHEHPLTGLQWTRTLEMRGLLREYNTALLQFASLCRLAPVNKADLATLHELLEKPPGSGDSFLTAHEFETWDEENIKDLTSVAGLHTDRDALSRFIDKMAKSVYHKHVGHKFHDPIAVVEAWAGAGKHKHIINYPDSYITTTIDTLSTILASVLPTVAAFGIYLINDPKKRMAAIVACTLLFSTVLSLVARPKRAECFAASAAFAAVLVVFVGNSNGNSC
ncbi:uncharacterized protein PV07_00514 [Cladophialophora immunda]|uniref:DUF6594 domain-containing protein n=1 Tax=Cladophialophora immunda TaxID=569365 RepID=A0A0D1ZZU5_9EURO|nr:uncharacterized protein PV07_00514 [Cladophialophora immunda]KIW33686.1 hypothetical protein PV07_00514 [Cladophialophora immunda]OQU94161.1 hypothetical protein CLAIMM_00560 [Cladophialophora immunda]